MCAFRVSPECWYHTWLVYQSSTERALGWVRLYVADRILNPVERTRSPHSLLNEDHSLSSQNTNLPDPACKKAHARAYPTRKGHLLTQALHLVELNVPNAIDDEPRWKTRDPSSSSEIPPSGKSLLDLGGSPLPSSRTSPWMTNPRRVHDILCCANQQQNDRPMSAVLSQVTLQVSLQVIPGKDGSTASKSISLFYLKKLVLYITNRLW